MKKRVVAIAIFAIIIITSLSVYAAPYSNYTFNHKGDYYYEPQAMIPEAYYDWTKMIADRPDADELRQKPLNNPGDFTVADNGMMLISDTDNNRLVILNDQFKLLNIIEKFTFEGKENTFNAPSGMCFDKNGKLYVADTSNGRIVRFSIDKEGNYTCDSIYGAPDIAHIVDVSKTAIPGATSTPNPEATAAPDGENTENKENKENEEENKGDGNFVYQPLKVVVDTTERIYVIAKGVNQGIIELNKDGTFSQFIAAARVSPSFTELLRRRFLSEAQLERVYKFVPPEYSNISIDKEGFIFGTISSMRPEEIAPHIAAGKDATESGATIRRLTADGVDVLRRMGNFPPVGDVILEDAKNVGYSYLVDIEVFSSGIYSVLDMKRSKVFTYDTDGNLLFVFGTMGTVLGAIQRATALEIMPGEQRMAVLDGDIGQITVFKPSEYAKIIMDANKLKSELNEDAANAKWDELLNISSNSEIGYVGKGKYEMNKGNYKAAMQYFKLGNDRVNYSAALELHRQGIFNVWLPKLLTVVIVLIVVWFAYFIFKKIRDFGKGAKVKK